MPFTSLHFYQIAIILISLTMIYFGLEKYFRREATQSLLKLAVRIIVWGGMTAIALFPDLSDKMADFIGIEDNINAVILTGFLLVFLIIFKILSVVERIEQEISTLTREDALADYRARSKNSRLVSPTSSQTFQPRSEKKTSHLPGHPVYKKN